MGSKFELQFEDGEYYLVKSISNEDISLGDILLHNESGRIISVNRFWESNGSKTIMDTGLRNPIELVISGNTFKKLIGYYSEYQKLPLSKLSHKNCQAIANGYDLDELFESIPIGPTDENGRWKLRAGFITGFQKALEILGDKKFSEDDMKKACAIGIDIAVKEGENDFNLFEELLESLQQTEWDVVPEVVLDENGCLILKRK